MSILGYSGIVMGRSAICRCMSYWIQWFRIAMLDCFKLNETCFHTPGFSIDDFSKPLFLGATTRSLENQTALKGTQIGQKTGSIFDNFLLLGWKKGWWWGVIQSWVVSRIPKRTEKRWVLSGYMGFKSFRNLYQILKMAFQDENCCQRWWFSTWNKRSF